MWYLEATTVLEEPLIREKQGYRKAPPIDCKRPTRLVQPISSNKFQAQQLLSVQLAIMW